MYSAPIEMRSFASSSLCVFVLFCVCVFVCVFVFFFASSFLCRERRRIFRLRSLNSASSFSEICVFVLQQKPKRCKHSSGEYCTRVYHWCLFCYLNGARGFGPVFMNLLNSLFICVYFHIMFKQKNAPYVCNTNIYQIWWNITDLIVVLKQYSHTKKLMIYVYLKSDMFIAKSHCALHLPFSRVPFYKTNKTQCRQWFREGQGQGHKCPSRSESALCCGSLLVFRLRWC